MVNHDQNFTTINPSCFFWFMVFVCNKQSTYSKYQSQYKIRGSLYNNLRIGLNRLTVQTRTQCSSLYCLPSKTGEVTVLFWTNSFKMNSSAIHMCMFRHWELESSNSFQKFSSTYRFHHDFKESIITKYF